MRLQPGEILDGKYRIVRPIGEGGMGTVYEGENTRIRRRVAIKVLHAAVAEKQDVVQRFEREAQAAGRIGSEHIVEVLDLGNLHSGERYMVMEFLDGEDFTQRIKRLGRLTPEQVAPLLVQVLEGLAAAHDAGIIHRDLKPDNIYILQRGGGRTDFVKLLDFGVSKFSALDDEMSMTRTGAVMGTPYYMSPEQAKGSPIDVRSDLYAIGVVAYQMLTGRVPFNAGSFNELLFKIVLEQPEPLERVVPGLDPGFTGIVHRAMARDPEARFQSAREFQTALKAWQPLFAHLAGYDVNATLALPDALPPPHASQPAFAPPPRASQPGFGAPPPAYALSTPGVAAPNGGFYGSQHGLSAEAVSRESQSGALPTGTSGGDPVLAASQVGLALTPPPQSAGRGTKVALALVVTALLGALGFGAYILTGINPSPGPPPKPGGTLPNAATKPTASATSATGSPVSPAATATALAQAASADAATSPPTAPSGAPAPTPATSPAGGAGTAKPLPIPAAPTPTGTSGTTKTPPTATGGRKINTDL